MSVTWAIILRIASAIVTLIGVFIAFGVAKLTGNLFGVFLVAFLLYVASSIVPDRVVAGRRVPPA